jgi:hypothetical protein
MLIKSKKRTNVLNKQKTFNFNINSKENIIGVNVNIILYKKGKITMYKKRNIIDRYFNAYFIVLF